MAARALLFDLDGTVWDSFPWYGAVLEECAGFPDAEARLRAGDSLLTLARAGGIGRDRLFRECAATVTQLHLYPGVQRTLAVLRERGTLVGAVTSLPGPLATAGLQRTGLADRFAALVHAGHGRPYKPRPDPLLKALNQLALKPSREIFYVGDFLSDGEASLAAGLSFAWASYGYGPKHPRTDVVIDRFEDVLAL